MAALLANVGARLFGAPARVTENDDGGALLGQREGDSAADAAGDHTDAPLHSAHLAYQPLLGAHHVIVGGAHGHRAWDRSAACG